jgi:hypothetical protein
VEKPLKTQAGAVYVELLVALVPMFTLFWGLVQLNGLFLADLVTQHAAVSAVRAAVVCEPDNHRLRPESGQECAEGAVREILGMGAAKKTVASIQQASVSLSGASASGTGPVTATVRAEYRCEVPLVAWLVCGLAGGASGHASAVITRKATLPNQGAFYAYSD